MASSTWFVSDDASIVSREKTPTLTLAMVGQAGLVQFIFHVTAVRRDSVYESFKLIQADHGTRPYETSH